MTCPFLHHQQFGSWLGLVIYRCILGSQAWWRNSHCPYLPGRTAGGCQQRTRQCFLTLPERTKEWGQPTSLLAPSPEDHRFASAVGMAGWDWERCLLVKQLWETPAWWMTQALGSGASLDASPLSRRDHTGTSGWAPTKTDRCSKSPNHQLWFAGIPQAQCLDPQYPKLGTWKKGL